MSSSPRPIAHRAFTVLLAFLLVGSVLAPIGAAEPAAAQSDGSISIEEDCGAAAKFAFPRSCHAAEMAFGSVDTTQSADLIETDVHVSAQTLYENWESQDVVYQNYLQDTSTLASLEARNAIADAYEANESVTAAQAAGQAAINDYYAVHQTNVVEMQDQHTARLLYLMNVSENTSDVPDEFISPWQGKYNSLGTTEWDPNVTGTMTETMTLANGSTHEATVPDLYFSGGTDGINNSPDGFYSYYNSSRDEFVYPSSYASEDADWGGGFTVMNSPSANLSTQTVYEYAEVARLLDELEQQAQTVQSNYDDAAAEDLYAAMDSGQISPNDVRGAEGMVRYMSGADDGSNVTRDRFNLALRSTLGLGSADLGSTMVVDFEGATERVRNVTPENETVEYNHVNETYEGLLFSSETPDGGFETGTLYNVSNFNGTVTMVYADGASEETFYRGDFTITEMYDEDGNSVNQTNWSDPQYDSYNATEFVKALELAQEQRAAINGNDGSDGDSGISIGDPFPDLGSGGAVVGLVIVVAAVGVVAAVVFRRP